MTIKRISVKSSEGIVSEGIVSEGIVSEGIDSEGIHSEVYIQRYTFRGIHSEVYIQRYIFRGIYSEDGASASRPSFRRSQSSSRIWGFFRSILMAIACLMCESNRDNFLNLSQKIIHQQNFINSVVALRRLSVANFATKLAHA
jgi:hypothetical protein